MNADEINNFMLGKNVPRDMFIGEKLPNYLARKFKELEAAAAELLEYAKDNKPHGEESQWLGPHPIDVMDKLLK